MTHVIEVPFHIGDFLSGTMGFDATEVGAYWMLCVAHYQHGEQGLKDDDKTLATIARVSMKVWKRIRPKLEEKFSVSDGWWTHSGVLRRLQKINEMSAQNKAKALKRWNADDARASKRHKPRHYSGTANQKPYINPLPRTNRQRVDGGSAPRAETHATPPSELPEWKKKLAARIGEKNISVWFDGVEMREEALYVPRAFQVSKIKTEFMIDLEAVFGKTFEINPS